MNTPPPTPPPAAMPSPQPPKPPESAVMKLSPIEGTLTPMKTLDLLLKRPGHVVHGLAVVTAPKLRLWLGVLALVAMLAFGLVLGSFSGGMQWWAAPLKITTGQMCAALLCLPSLYVFVSMSGSDLRLGSVLGLLLGASALTGVMLATFAPVIWLFSQSTDSIGFMTVLTLLIWGIASVFAMGFLRRAFATLGESLTWHFKPELRD